MLRSFEVVLTQELEVLAILKGGGGGAHKVSNLIFFLKGVGGGGEAANSIGPRIFLFGSTPVINDQPISNFDGDPLISHYHVVTK